MNGAHVQTHDELTYAIEALLFASERPITATQIKEALSGEGGPVSEPLSDEDVSGRLDALKADYEAQRRGFRLFEIAGGYQLVTDPRFEAHLKRFFSERLKKRLSQATLETLSIIAYRQPVTRADIEFVRGVNVDAAVRVLMEKGLIRIIGKKEVPGRPLLYGTTALFLEHFGLNSLRDLPPLSQYTEKDIDENLLPPEMKREDQGEQKPIGCANEPGQEEERQA